MEALIVVHEGLDLRRHAIGEWFASKFLALASFAYGVFSVWAWQGGSIVFGMLLSLACAATFLAYRWFDDSQRNAFALLRARPALPAARLRKSRH